MGKMCREKRYRLDIFLLTVLALVAGLTYIPLGVFGQSGGSEVPWTSWGGDIANTRYRPFDQINASNFSKLEVAWRFKTDNLGPRPEYKLEGTPLMVHGVIYATGGTRRSVVALDAATGELKWVHTEDEGLRGSNAPRLLSGRGLAYWSDGKEERILYVTPGYRLIALNAKTGQPVPSFGDNGVVDLRLNDDQQMDLIHADIGLHATPLVTKDLVIIGAAHNGSEVPPTKANIKGYVRGFDVRTGKRLWIFHTVPMKGEFGYDSWGKVNGVSSAEYTGNTGMWAQAAADEELGLAYLPIELATSDKFGGARPGADLFSESLVAVDLKTGKRKWHYQTIHHGMWDSDIPSAPILANINVDGKAIKAIIISGKQGFLYVLNRETGEPVWPIPETPVPAGDVPGEWYSPTQPIPSKPPAIGPNFTSLDSLIDFTPELKEEAEVVVKHYKMGIVFTPPALSKADGYIASFSPGPPDGMVSWGGGSYDPETQKAYFQVCDSCIGTKGVVPTPSSAVSDLDYVNGVAGKIPRPGKGPRTSADIPRMLGDPAPAGAGGGDGEGGGPLMIHGMIIWKPPYGTMTAVDMKTGTIAWKVPHGDTPDNVRNNPVLKGLNISKTGQYAAPNSSSLVTKTMVISGDPEFTTTSSHPRGALLHAYDKATGQEVGSIYMPAPQTGGPMTYMLDGRQYIVIAIGGGIYSTEYVAYRLPKNAN